MASSQELKHRTPPQEQTDHTHTDNPNVIKTTTDDATTTTRKPKRTTTARRGLRSLSLAVAFPLLLSVFNIFYFGSSTRYRSIQKPFYFPPLWALHLSCLGTVFLSGLSAWLVWAEGGFHRQPNALALYLSQLVLSLGWYPVVFEAGAIRVGLVLCAALFGVLVGCSWMFKRIKPIAGDLVKPCLVWAVLLALVNVRLVTTS